MPVPKPKLGQHFLSDAEAAERIVAALGDISQSRVIEIGPGGGSITSLLAAKARHVTAIEFDRMLATQLRVKYSSKPHVEIIEADVLSIDFDTLVQGNLVGLAGLQQTTSANEAPLQIGRRKTARVVGNLPYYITSDILLKLFEYHHNFDWIVIMVQREVADRLAAAPGSRDYGLLTVTAQLYVDVENLFTLPPHAFMPPPKVHSSVLRLRVSPKAQQLGVDGGKLPDFVRFLKACFAQKRKTLVNNLKSANLAANAAALNARALRSRRSAKAEGSAKPIPSAAKPARSGDNSIARHFDDAVVRSALKEVGLRADVRAEAISLEQLAKVYQLLAVSA